MIKLCGKVINLYISPEGVNKDGQKYGGEYRLQLQREEFLKNDEKKIVTEDLKINSSVFAQYKVGEDVELSVSLFVRNNKAYFSFIGS